MGILASLAYCAAAAFAAIFFSTQQPYLGLTLKGMDSGEVRVVQCKQPCSDVPATVLLHAVAATSTPEQRFDISAFDLTEEPDVLPDHAAISTLFQRQNALHQILETRSVMLFWSEAGSVTQRTSVVAAIDRPWHSLPTMFWFQLLVATTGCVLACWVWALKPHDWGSRIFGFSGLMFPVFAMAAAVYSTRELALSAQLFSNLSLVNHFGALVYGAAFAGIFLAHPRLLARPWILVALPFIAAGWWLLGALGIITDPDWTIRLPTLFEMLAAVVLGCFQWFRSRRQVVDRAALRWLVLSFLIGGGLFITNHVVSSLLGLPPFVAQGYAFGFFLLIYLGIALGLRRYRLFDLDIWAYRVLTFVVMVLLVIALDIALISLLGWSSSLALGSSIWMAAALYFPFRNWLWDSLTNRKKLEFDRILPDLVSVAFEPDIQERDRMWSELLQKLYNPAGMEKGIEIKSSHPNAHVATLDDHGTVLNVPHCARLDARRLLFRDQGNRLFSPRDTTLIDTMRGLLERADSGRVAFETAVQTERSRIARDLHDDVGASLLTLLHRAPSSELRELAHTALNDLRGALAAIDGQPSPLSHCLADWHAEAQARCDAAQAKLEWSENVVNSDAELSPQLKMVLTRAIRESISNSLKHAQTITLKLRLSLAVTADGTIELRCHDNGCMSDPSTWTKGRGLTGLEKRITQIGGKLNLLHEPGAGNGLTILLPLRSQRTAAQT